MTLHDIVEERGYVLLFTGKAIEMDNSVWYVIVAKTDEGFKVATVTSFGTWMTVWDFTDKGNALRAFDAIIDDLQITS